MYEPIAVLALGAAAIVPALGLSWRAASLRGDLYAKWSDRIDIAEAGLSERAVRLLRELQVRTDEILGSQVAGFDPNLALADPAPLTKLTRKFNRTIRARKRLQRRFRLMVVIGAVAPFVLIPYLLGATGITTYYAGWHDRKWVADVGIYFVVCALGVWAMALFTYLYLNWRLTTAEIMSDDTGSSDWVAPRG